MKNTRERVRDIEDTMRRSNMNLIKVPKGEEIQNRIEAEIGQQFSKTDERYQVMDLRIHIKDK